jgi:hypothetical protein
MVDALMGSWNLNGIVSFSSGTPFDVGTGKGLANTGNYNYENGYGYERLNLIGSPYPASKGRDEWVNPAGFQEPARYTFGNVGRDSLRSDRYKNLDPALFRQFQIAERFRMEFRFEAFNATSTPVWAVPVTNLDAPNFGARDQHTQYRAAVAVWTQALLLSLEARHSGGFRTQQRAPSAKWRWCLWNSCQSALGIMNSLSRSAQTPHCRLHFLLDSRPAELFKAFSARIRVHDAEC